MTFFDRLRRLLGSSQGSTRQGGGNGKPSGEAQPIACMEAMAKVQEYLDGELNDVSHEEVAQHFSMCKRCYPHLKLEESFKELLHRSAEEEACPEHVRNQVLELLAQESGQGG
ncbi:MAG: mycothiol system anti-sigma-R factor [Gemmatimonadetes bacterium]|nr:mycothiol system anti-sigma-R factor [Gemmatimonadota bacterium]